MTVCNSPARTGVPVDAIHVSLRSANPKSAGVARKNAVAAARTLIELILRMNHPRRV
jgi:hypothetical protein